MAVEILVDGRPALTTTQAAKQRGITAAGMRAVIKQAGLRPVARLDARTPLYDVDDLARLPEAGRGAHFRRSTGSDQVH